MMFSNGVNNTPLLAHFDSATDSKLRVLISTRAGRGRITVRVFDTLSTPTFDVSHGVYLDSYEAQNVQLDLGAFAVNGGLLQCDVAFDGAFEGDAMATIVAEDA